MPRGLNHAFGLLVLGTVMLAARGAEAQTTAVGPYHATPAWDQTFACTSLASCSRFVVLSNFAGQAALDRETGLVWERSPDTDFQTQRSALFLCVRKTVGSRMGWRLPTIQELTTLVDPTVNSLPAGHPFSNVGSPQTTRYWSATSYSVDPNYAWTTNFETTGTTILLKGTAISNSIEQLAWCVRGGSVVDPQ
jgi:hypothetical protein